MKSFYDSARGIRCRVPAPSVSFGVGAWMVIARQYFVGEGGEHRGRSAAGPEGGIWWSGGRLA